MSTPLVASLPGNESSAAALGAALSAPAIDIAVHRFPDGESLIRYPAPVAGHDVILFCTLNHPDEKFLPLLFAAETARDLGAASVGLIAPYLCYMRQDARFRSGEALSAKIFASALSGAVDWLVTIDPHLHRTGSLSELFSVPVDVLHADAEIAAWIEKNVREPVLIGPDVESKQWVEKVAGLVNCPAIILTKQREGDRNVRISVPDPDILSGRTPIILDDIISTGQTMRETVLKIKQSGAQLPVCLGVHAVFAGTAYSDLASTGAHIVTTNTIPHSTNEIDLLPIITGAVSQHLRKP